MSPRPRVRLDSARARAVTERARAIPAGLVTTYGDLSPGAPRYAGAVLAACDDPAVPWQRVVRADGSLPKGVRQRLLLEHEGVPFRGSRVDMRAAWTPAGGPGAAPAGHGAAPGGPGAAPAAHGRKMRSAGSDTSH